MNMRSVRTLLLASTLVALAACSSTPPAPPAPAKVADGVLVDARGMTLYTFDRDTTPGKSACNGQCAINWPPLSAGDKDMAKGDWSVITRDDGKKQWAYKGRPLYLWIKDTKPGEKTGEGMANNTWHVAKP